MSISLALIPTALLLKVILFDKDYEQLIKGNSKSLKNLKLPTNYKDMELLIKTLRNFNAQHLKTENENISCRIEEYNMNFLKGSEGYTVSIAKVKNAEKLLKELRSLDGLYKQNLQEQVYCRTKQRLKERGMSIESEEVLEDNSIVLTITI